MVQKNELEMLFGLQIKKLKNEISTLSSRFSRSKDLVLQIFKNLDKSFVLMAHESNREPQAPKKARRGAPEYRRIGL